MTVWFPLRITQPGFDASSALLYIISCMRKIFIPLLIIFLSIPGFAQSVAQAGLLKLFPVLFAQAQPVPDSSWSPEWPADLPPDAFFVSAGTVGSIELSAELLAAPSESSSTETVKTEKTVTAKPATAPTVAPKATPATSAPKPAVSKSAPLKSDATKPGLATADSSAASGATATGEDGSGPLEVKYSVASGAFELPVFIAGAAYSLRAVMDASGRIRSFTMTKTAEKAGKEPGAGTGKESAYTAGLEGESTKVSLEYDPSGILMRSTIEAGEDTSFSTFSVRESLVEELVYDAEGSALARFVYHRGRTGVRSLEQVGEDGIPSLMVGFDYDGRGRVSAVGTGSGSTETLYDALARPVFIRTLAAENAVTERRLQWDERNLLVRETRLEQDGKKMEFRYDYVFDAYGNWTERRSLVYTERLGAYIPRNGPQVTRKIIYR